MVLREEFFMIRDLKSKGMSNTQIAKEMDVDRKTVAKWLSIDEIPCYKKRLPILGKLDPYKTYILERMNEGCLNSSVLLDEITGMGYEGKSTILRVFMQEYREQAIAKATIRYETPPGKQAQVDWGEFKVQRPDGSMMQVHAFVMILGYSRMQYVEFTEDEKLETLIGCHERAFKYFGGIPETILYDNMKTVVKHIHLKGESKWNERFLRFAQHHGFNPISCKPYRPKTKGKVENGVKYLRRNFWPRVKMISGLAELNEMVWAWLEETCNVRLHSTTRKIPRHELEHENLSPIAPEAFLQTDLQSRKVSNDCVVSYESNYYSVPFQYAGLRVGLKDHRNGTIEIFDESGTRIASHAKSTGKHQYQKNKKHFEGITQSQNKNASKAPILIPEQTPKVHQRPLEVYDSLVNEVMS